MLNRKKTPTMASDFSTSARVVKLGENYIVLGPGNEPLSARYSADSFRFITDSAKSVLRIATRDGRTPSDAIIALANYTHPGRKSA